MNIWKNSKKHAWIGGVLAGVCCFGLGLAEGQFAVIWKKEVMICLECIGIGKCAGRVWD